MVESKVTAEFEDYSKTSTDYDSTRIPVGTTFILQTLWTTNKKPLKKQHLLDAGCGTGNYTNVLREWIGNVTGIELNKGMLNQARQKLSDAKNVILDSGNICHLPTHYKKNTFDGIICNQVLHHLDNSELQNEGKNNTFPRVTEFIKGAFQVLKPEGALIINTTSHEQLDKGFWYLPLIPTAVVKLKKRLPTIKFFESICSNTGFIEVCSTKEIKGILQGPDYFQHNGPLIKEWRNCDSTWALATTDEINSAKQHVKEMIEEKTITAFIQKSEDFRSKHGQSTFVVAKKPSSHPEVFFKKKEGPKVLTPQSFQRSSPEFT
jgi:ubiquinone/menaquinone biosynthesis C-methylase UbiE